MTIMLVVFCSLHQISPHLSCNPAVCSEVSAVTSSREHFICIFYFFTYTHRALSSLHCSVVLFDLLVNILGHNLAEPAYEAEVAQLEYKLVAGEHGLVIKVKGFDDKLPVSQ